MKLQGRRVPSVRFVPTRNACLLGDGHLAVPLDLLSLPSGAFREPLTCAASVETLSCRLLAFYLIFSTFYIQPGCSTLCMHSCNPPLLRFTGCLLRRFPCSRLLPEGRGPLSVVKVQPFPIPFRLRSFSLPCRLTPRSKP